MASTFFLKSSRIVLAGSSLAIAVSAKLSMIVALPLLYIYLHNNRSWRPFAFPFVRTFLVFSFIFQLPFFMSNDAVSMLLGTPYLVNAVSLNINVGQGLKIYLLPFFYALFVYFVWRTRRLNYELLLATLALTFLLMILTTIASPSWFIWALPFLVFIQTKSDRFSGVLVVTLALLFAADLTLHSPISTGGISGRPLVSNLIPGNY